MNLPDFPNPYNAVLPAGFDPAIHPILAKHVFGIAPETVRRARLVEHLHKLGPRPTLEFLAELVAEHGISNDVDRRLEQYAELDAETVAQLGGRHLPEPPLVEVR